MNLLSQDISNLVQPTSLTRKLTIDGQTKAFPVYRVNLKCLFYNDQNDRIATWISQYKSENGENAFRTLTQEDYNSIIEKFIIESNPTSIEKTQVNIELVNQREPGVILSDGRIIDGNRRFTCLRRLATNKPEFEWFETVILDIRLKNSRKQIKMLELTIQHGEEKKVDYNPVDRLVGVYQDIIKTQLLTIDEYAQSTNETVLEVKKHLEQAKLLVEFLEYINLPEQYHIAREYQMVSIFADMPTLLKKCKKDAERISLKEAIFNNILMKTIGDSRKYIRNISSMMSTGIFSTYLKRQSQIGNELKSKLQEQSPKNLDELNNFVKSNSDLAEELKNTLDSSLLKAKKRETKAKPSQSVSKSITMLKDIDTNIFETLNDDERDKLKDNIEQLSEKVNTLKSKLLENSLEPLELSDIIAEETPINTENISHDILNINSNLNSNIPYYIAFRHIDEPMINCLDINKIITNLSFSLNFHIDEILPFQKNEAEYQLFFLDSQNKKVSEIKSIKVYSGQNIKCDFILNSEMSQQSMCSLAIRSVIDGENQLQQLIPFKINITFSADFGF